MRRWYSVTIITDERAYRLVTCKALLFYISKGRAAKQIEEGSWFYNQLPSSIEMSI